MENFFGKTKNEVFYEYEYTFETLKHSKNSNQIKWINTCTIQEATFINA